MTLYIKLNSRPVYLLTSLFFLLIIPPSSYSQDSLYCELFSDTKLLLSAQFDQFDSSTALSTGDSLLIVGECELALDTITTWELAQVDTSKLTAETQTELQNLDTVLLNALMSIEEEKKDTLETKEDRSSTHALSFVTNVYNSEDESYTIDSLDGNLNSFTYQETVPGETHFTVGWERRDITSNPYSLFRYTNNRLSVLNDHVYNRLENDLGGYLAKGKVDLNLNSVATLKWEYSDSTTSFFNGALEPSIYFNPNLNWKMGVKPYGEIKIHRNQSTGYENFRTHSFAGDINYIGDVLEGSFDGSFTQKVYLDSSFKDYNWGIIDLTLRYIPNDILLIEAYLNRDQLTFVNDSLGPEKETGLLGESNFILFLPYDFEFSLLVSMERTKFLQFDTLSSLVGTEIFSTNYSTLKGSIEPWVRLPIINNFGLESSMAFELLKVQQIDSTQWTQPDAANYFTPKDDNYRRWSLALFGSFSLNHMSTSLGVQYEKINYQDSEFYQVPDYKTLDLMFDLSYSLGQKWNIYFNVEWPIIQYLGEDSNNDKYISLEVDYQL